MFQKKITVNYNLIWELFLTEILQELCHPETSTAFLYLQPE